jgi:hypothetical protein
VSQLEGVGEKLAERLADADIGSVQRLAGTDPELLQRIDGVGPKTAETLVERAKAFVEQLEADYEKRRKAEVAIDKVQDAARRDDEKLSVTDVFEDDEEYVTEADDQQEARAPEIDDEDVEDEDLEYVVPVSEDEADEDELVNQNEEGEHSERKED